MASLRFWSMALVGSVSLLGCGGHDASHPNPQQATRTVIMVGRLRPDSVTQADTPNLYALRQAGVNFTDNHSTYPTFTMMNGSSFATGSFPKTSGFYGNTFWTPPQGVEHDPRRQVGFGRESGLRRSRVHRGLSSPDHAQ